MLSNRRQFLLQAGGGMGAVAFSAMGAARGVAPGTHFAPRAKRVLWVFMHGGPSHMDLWDPKPDLTKYAGQPLPCLLYTSPSPRD